MEAFGGPLGLVLAVRVLALVAAPLGCGGSASLVLKAPIEQGCRDAGLQGCPELSNGILEYVEGDKARGTRQVIRAGAANSPQRIKAFADTLRKLREVPGAAAYASPVIEVADLLVADAARVDPAILQPATTSTASVAAGPAAVVHWEYLAENVARAELTDALTSLGAKRWELIAVMPEQDGSVTCVLKRPRK